MILIFSTEQFEESTEQVLDWLEHLGLPYLRVNGEDLGNIAFALDPSDPDQSWLEIGGSRLTIGKVKGIWYRRTGQRPFLHLHPIASMTMRLEIAQHLNTEIRALKRSIYALLEGKNWLSHTQTASPNKLDMLQQAHKLGIGIPRTKIVSRSAELKELRRDWGPVIVKCMSDLRALKVNDQLFIQYTTSPDPILEALPEAIFPTLVQAQIEKAYEVRTFFLDGSCHSMAIFSQANRQTRTDFRIYDYHKPARMIPYRLPKDLTEKTRQLMAHFHLDTGSIDFIVDPEGCHYFLEINPVGQFGMVSQPCNYRLEKKIAQRLAQEHAA